METQAASRPVMMICPNLKCRKVLQVPGKYRGQHVKCHYCGTTFAVPIVQSRAVPEPAEAKKPENKKDEKPEAKKPA